MLKELSRTRLVGFWLAATAAISAWIVATRATIDVSTVALLLTICLVPPAIMLFIWRAPSPTVRELLYSTKK